MGLVQPLTIASASITPFQLTLRKPFTFGGNTVTERVGFYLKLITTTGLPAQGEIAPLPGISSETIRKAQHDLEEIKPYLTKWEIPADKKDLIAKIRSDAHFSSLCHSVRFGIESALFSLAASVCSQSLVEFLGGDLSNVSSAALLQGTHQEVLNDAKMMSTEGVRVFKLKVGDRNIPLDVKKVQDLRSIIGKQGSLRLDGNRVWSLQEALLFVELIGLKQIEFIEEPLSDIAKINVFYEQTHMPVALDETLSVLRCGISAPGRCSPTLAHNEAVKAYVLKPMILGGIIATLDWIEEARQNGKKAIISSCFESVIGLKVLADLSLLTGQVAGLGTARWLYGNQDLLK